MGVPLYVICCSSLVAFNIFSLYLIFLNLITICLGVFLLGFILPGTLYTSWTWVTVSFPMFAKFSAIISSSIFSGPFSLSSPSGTPIMQMFVHLTLSQRSQAVFISFHSFFFILFYNSDFHHSVFQLTYPFVCSLILLLFPSSVFFISDIVLFICLFLSSSRFLYLLKPCLHSFSEILDHLYYHYSEFFYG